MYDIKAVGKQIKNHRHRMKITQSELAERLMVSFQAVSSWENSVTVPDIENLCKLAMVFNVSLDTLLQGNEGSAMIAVDGGGSKSEFVLFTAQGQVLMQFKLGGTNVAVSGFEQVLDTLYQGIDMCIGQRLDVSTVYIGTAGSKLGELQEQLSLRYPKLNIYVESDGLNALYCDHGDAALICGTGSILIIKDGDGIRRVGGWGYRISDPGSGYNFGREALLACANHEDGIEESPVIHKKVCEHLKIPALRGARISRNVSSVAALACLVFEAYREGDSQAAEIIRRQMKEVSQQINAACGAGTRLILCGGILENYRADLVPILREFVTNVEFVLPTLPPVYGASVRCCHLSGITCGAEYKNQFTRDYQRSACCEKL